VTPPQIRAARGLLNWTVQELAEKAGLDRNAVAQIESGKYAIDAECMAAIAEYWRPLVLSSRMAGGQG